MGSENFIDKLRRIFWNEPINKVEYWFAKKWLDKTFGKREYWGDFLQGVLQGANNKVS